MYERQLNVLCGWPSWCMLIESRQDSIPQTDAESKEVCCKQLCRVASSMKLNSVSEHYCINCYTFFKASLCAHDVRPVCTSPSNLCTRLPTPLVHPCPHKVSSLIGQNNRMSDICNKKQGSTCIRLKRQMLAYLQTRE